MSDSNNKDLFEEENNTSDLGDEEINSFEDFMEALEGAIKEIKREEGAEDEEVSEEELTAVAQVLLEKMAASSDEGEPQDLAEDDDEDEFEPYEPLSDEEFEALMESLAEEADDLDDLGEEDPELSPLDDSGFADDDALIADEGEEEDGLERAVQLYRLVDVLKKAEFKLRTGLSGVMSEIENASSEESVEAEEASSEQEATAEPENDSSDKSSGKKKKKKKNKNKNKNKGEDLSEEVKTDGSQEKSEPVAAINNSFTEAFMANKREEKNIATGSVGTIEWSDKHSAVYSNGSIPEHHRDFHLVHRNRSEIEDLSVMHTYLGYKKAYDPGVNGWDMILDYNSGEKIGAIPHIKLSLAWELAKRYNGYDNDVEVGVKYGITFFDWKNAVKAIEKYIRNSDIEVEGVNKNVTVLIQHLFKVPTLDYQLLFIKKSEKVFEVVRDAILCDIKETAKAVKQWKKIKTYKYRVPLHTENGGIFSGDDVNKLHAGVGIRFLNDLCMYSVYDLKSQSLDHSFGGIVKEINAAFHEDKQKRRDRALQKYPFIVGNLALLLLTILAYVFQYTLIKDIPMTVIVNMASTAWVVMNLVIVWACIRSKLRKKKIPGYAYMTKKIRKRLTWMSIFALFVVSSLICFYQRYDGYNSRFYYRDIGDGEIAIAGLVDKEQSELIIPETMDDKTVTKIDLYAFDGELMNTAYLPSTVEVIANSAFKNCTSLVRVGYVDEGERAPLVIEKKAFQGCSALDECTVTSGATTISKKAFRDCIYLRSILLDNASVIEDQAFENCTSLADVRIGSSLETLPQNVFKDCYNITKVEGFENVKYVGNEAFYGCTSLQNVDLTNVLTIGKKSFYGCYGLTNIYISNTVTEIGEDAFSSCSSVTDIVIPYFGKNLESSATSSLDYYFNCTERSANSLSVTVNGVDAIYKKNFENCFDVTDVTLGDSVTSIEAGAFKDSQIYSITLSPSISSIGDETFMGCTYLNTVNGAEHINSVGKSAFRSCGSLSTLNLISAATIGQEAFYNCYSINSVTFGPALTSIGKNAFEECSSLMSVDLSGTACSSIGSYAFNNCNQLSAALLPLDLTSLPEGIFNGCYNLESVTMGTELTEIGSKAFQNTSVGNFDFTNIKEIGNSAFNNCSNITEVVIPNEIEVLGTNAFANCYNLTSYTGPFSVGSNNHDCSSLLAGTGLTTLTVTKLTRAANNFLGNLDGVVTVVFDCELTSIENNAFSYKYSLKNITLPDTLKTIGESAFYDCDGLESITIPASVTAIKSEAFSECDNISSFVIPDGVSAIEKGVFENCTGLLSVTIPDGITEIREYAFNGCYNLGTVELPSALVTIGKSAFSGCSEFDSITLPDGVKTISSYAFSSCTGISSIDFGSSLNNIGESAFWGCTNLTEIVIPETVTVIGANAFRDCSQIETAVVSSNATSIGSDIFTGCYSLYSLTIPFLGGSASSAMDISYVTDSYYLRTIAITGAKKIAEEAFKNLSYLTLLVLNDGINSIGNNAFADCISLTRVVFPSESVWKSHKSVFEDVPVYQSLTSEESYAEKEARIEAEEAAKKEAEEAAKKEAQGK